MPSRVTRAGLSQGVPETGFKYNPLQQVRILYNSFVKGLFAAAPPGWYHWTPDETTSEIYISDEAPIDAERAGARPAVSFTRGAVQFYSLGMDDMLRFDSRTGKKTKSVLVPGVMSINCCSRNDIESERIAWLIAEHLWLLRELLMGLDGFFEIGRQPNIGAPSPAGSIVTNDGNREWHCTTVMSPFQFPRTSQFTPLNQRVLNNVQIQLRQQMSKLDSKGFPASANAAEYPVQMQICPPESYAPDASDARGRAPDPAGLLPPPPPLQPHPLNPSVKVTLRSVTPYAPGLRPPSIGGRPIPIANPCVKESGASQPVSSTVKV